MWIFPNYGTFNFLTLLVTANPWQPLSRPLQPFRLVIPLIHVSLCAPSRSLKIIQSHMAAEDRWVTWPYRPKLRGVPAPAVRCSAKQNDTVAAYRIRGDCRGWLLTSTAGWSSAKQGYLSRVTPLFSAQRPREPASSSGSSRFSVHLVTGI